MYYLGLDKPLQQGSIPYKSWISLKKEINQKWFLNSHVSKNMMHHI